MPEVGEHRGGLTADPHLGHDGGEPRSGTARVPLVAMRTYQAVPILRAIVWEGESAQQFTYLAKEALGYNGPLQFREPVAQNGDDMGTIIVNGIPSYGKPNSYIALARGDSFVYSPLENTFFQIEGVNEGSHVRHV